MSNETATTAKGLFSGKARTVAAVAAFSGLALATTVSVQATQNADEQAPAAAVSEAPASENTVSAEPAAKADKAEKAEKATKSETKKADKVEAAAPAVQTSVVEAAPVADVTPLQAPAAQAPAVTTASENVTPVAEQAPVSQGRHAAPASQQTIQAEAAAQNYTAVSNTTIPDTTGVQSQNTGWTGHAAAADEKTQAPAAETSAPAAKVTTQSTSGQSSSAKGEAILGAAQGQIGVNQDCTALVSNSLKAVGINFHGWPADYKSLGTAVSADRARAGDIAYYADGGAGVAHVAIYAGNGQAVHGGWNGNQTVQTTANVGSGPEYIRVG
ncbi:C40 family peptidase [Kocuria varians]|uniref:Peptidoglycan endopeptidase RipA n=1 Tax=Kocuria varians TaxID=1272 RepID=A0A7D7Q556_KOCVA|nr:NlpC/P60 family protein [Kocuria varians]QMS56560.1 Peptidoglycan endopeptidase RipA [Kocuria varians]